MASNFRVAYEVALLSNAVKDDMSMNAVLLGGVSLAPKLVAGMSPDNAARLGGEVAAMVALWAGVAMPREVA